jgi:Ni/Co efflux regulator RcnB
VKRLLLLLVAALVLAAPFEANAALQCVTYARQESGINLKGDAWRWWDAANGVYERGRAPREGGVLVFAKQGSMRHGHVSVVTRVVSNRMVLVNHANWAPSRSAGRGQVHEAVPVVDVSAHNDWSQVRVWYRPANDYGNRVYKTDGFVYRPGVTVRKASYTTHAPAPVALPRVPAHEAITAAPAPTVVAPVVEAVKAETSAPAITPATPAPVVEAKGADTEHDKPTRGFNPGDWAEQAMSEPTADGLVTVAAHAFRRPALG